MALGSEEAWWLQNQGYGAGGDHTLELLQNQKATDIDQTRRRGDADLASKREMGDIYGELPGKALDAYWKGSEENRKGEAHDLAQRRGEQTMEFQQHQDERLGAEEARHSDTYDYNKGNRQYEQNSLQRADKASAAEEAYQNQVGDDGLTNFQRGRTLSMDTAQQGLSNAKLSGQLTQAQIGAAAANRNYTEEDRQTSKFNDLAAAAVEQATNMQERGSTPEQAQAYLTDSLMSDPGFAKLPNNQKQLYLQRAATQLAVKKNQGKASGDMVFNSSPEGARYNAAVDKMVTAEQAANKAAQAAKTVEDQIIGIGGIGYTREAGAAAKEQAAKQFEALGDHATATEIRNSMDRNTSNLVREKAADKLREAADQVRRATVGLDPARVQQGLKKAAELEQQADALGQSGPQELPSLMQGAAPNPQKPAGIQQAQQPPPPADTLGLFSNSKAKQKRAGYP